MFNTNDIKARQAVLFTVGSQTPQKRILIVAACRGIPYLNYLHRYNESAGRPFSITYINPNDYSFDIYGRPQDCLAKIETLETEAHLLRTISEADIFIHEHHENFGMFNTLKTAEKNIWQFGVRPDVVEICVPNFHNHFILSSDILKYCATDEVRADFKARGRLMLVDEHFLQATSEHHIRRFIKNCDLSSFPGFGCWFRQNWRVVRPFWTFNHVSAAFTLELFRRMNDQFLNLELDEKFWNAARSEDLFTYPRTPYTQLDESLLGVRWNFPIESPDI